MQVVSWRVAALRVFCQGADGKAIGPDSAQYGYLGVGRVRSELPKTRRKVAKCFEIFMKCAGEMIGGPLEDTSGPALNNFVKPLGPLKAESESLCVLTACFIRK